MEHNEFARAADIPVPTLKKWLGSARPNIRNSNVNRLSRALKLPPEEIERKIRDQVRPVAPITSRAADGVLPRGTVILKVRISENDLSFLATIYPGEALVRWAEEVLRRAVAKEREGVRSPSRRTA